MGQSEVMFLWILSFFFLSCNHAGWAARFSKRRVLFSGGEVLKPATCLLQIISLQMLFLLARKRNREL